MTHCPLTSLAIAGAWGYIGRKFLEAAGQLQIPTTVYDVGALPDDVQSQSIALVEREEQFYQQSADLFHLALHPEHRARGCRALLARARHEPIWVLCEKPMAEPESPQMCAAIVRAVAQSRAVVLYDFPELFDPITNRIVKFLRSGDEVQIDSIRLQRSKDREDPAIARNTKRMVHIQYQETVHCLAFVLYLLARINNGIADVLNNGLSVSARARPYAPPNPHAYPYVVDGRCEYELKIGSTRVDGLTDFTRGAPWSKRREIRGRKDGQPFRIEADFLEGKKWLEIDGQMQENVNTNSYAEVLKAIGRLRQGSSRDEVMSGVQPHPSFARITYQLSSVTWRSCSDEKTKRIDSLSDLLAFNAHFADAIAGFPRYG